MDGPYFKKPVHYITYNNVRSVYLKGLTSGRF